MDRTIQQPSPGQRLTVFCTLLAVCFPLLLCACDPGGQAEKALLAGRTPAPLPSPAISLSLQEQGTLQIQAFEEWISLMQRYGGSVGRYQQQDVSDQRALHTASGERAYLSALATLNRHVAAIKLPALRTEALSLQQQLAQQASAWSARHTYYDSYDGQTYPLGYEYRGVVSYPAQYLLDNAASLADYQYVIEQLYVWLTNLQAYQANVSDRTPYTRVHATDTRLLHQYGETTGKVLLISLSEQAMRIYQDGQLVNAFLVVTGMPDHPSLPGTWWVETRQTNIQFTSGKQPGQEGYYPPTPIAYAMQYHSGGYYIHQSWWRSQYGPSRQFPHIDPGGTSFADKGSHGCINMSTAAVQWVYNFVAVDSTRIIIY
jgi:lipoprotein-anchoring transpeptidase ErfK/SrfK